MILRVLLLLLFVLMPMIIYKITNLINNKVYIGLTTVSLEKRWTVHKTTAKNLKNTRHLYKSMRKYGIENFSIVQIDTATTIKELGEKERYYIKLYDSRNPEKGYNLTAGGEHNQWDANPRSKLNVEDVIQIREIYSTRELTVSSCWELYSDRISYSAFEKIWEGSTWANILPEVYTEENKKYYSTHKERCGEENGNSMYTNKEVLEIRKYYVDHTLNETFKKFGKNKTKGGFRCVIDKTYLDTVPRYIKIKKSWWFKGKEFNIDEFKFTDDEQK